MLKNLKTFFRYHRAERNGSIALLIIAVLVTVGVQLYSYFYTPEPVKDTAFLALVDSLERADKARLNASKDAGVLDSDKFRFNPNELNDSGYAALGFSEKEIQTLRNYMATGATFRIKTDFARLYFLSDSEYLALQPFIDLPKDYPSKYRADKPKYHRSEKGYNSYRKDTIEWSDTANTSLHKYKSFICDLNYADTTELKKLPYIGSFYAREIVRYREELGGYYEIGQLLELYKMTPQTINIIVDKVRIDTSAIRKLNINSATAQVLATHPYIDFKLASKIVLAREAAGGFDDMDALCESGLLNADLCLKLAPYLDF